MILPRVLLGTDAVSFCWWGYESRLGTLLTVGVLAEKTIPAGKTLSNLIGILLIIFGCYTFYGFFTNNTEGSLPSMSMNCMKMDGMKMDGMKMDGAKMEGMSSD